MKTPLMLLATSLALLNVSHGEITKDQLERVIKTAERRHEMMVFFFEQAVDPADPKSKPEVELTNRTLRKAASSHSANLMLIKAGDVTSIENLPECVKAARKGPAGQLILTNDRCTTVAATLDGKPDAKQVKEFRQQIEDGAKKLVPAMNFMPR